MRCCPKCGKETIPGGAYCVACGCSLSLQDAAPSPIVSLPKQAPSVADLPIQSSSFNQGPESTALVTSNDINSPVTKQPGTPTAIEVQFRMASVFGINGKGKWRKRGKLTFADSGLTISGNRRLELWIRWMIGISIFLVAITVTQILLGGCGILVLCIIINYFLLENDTITIPWDHINKWIITDQYAGIEANISSAKSPIVFDRGHSDEILSLLTKYAPTTGSASDSYYQFGSKNKI